MKLKKIIRLSWYQAKNQFRELAFAKKVAMVFEFFDIFIQPIIFSILFFVVAPNNRLLYTALILIVVYNLCAGINQVQQALKNKHREFSFKIFGYTPAEYRLGTDLFITFPRILSNLLYGLMLVGLTFFHYHQIFLVSLGLLLLVILCLPINYLVRSKLFELAFISDGMFAVLNNVINYPVFTVALLLINLKHFSFEVMMLISVFLTLSLLVSNCERFYKRYAFIRPRHNLLKELALAITESSYPLVSQFFMVGLFLAIGVYLLYFVIVGHYLETSNDPGKIRGVLYVFLPTSVLYNVQTSLSYYYAYDLEGQRMLTLKFLGNFISYKVKAKLKLAYLLSILPDSIFLVAFLLLYPYDDLIQYLIAYILCFLAHPLFFYLGSMYFPNYRRSMFDISQKLSNQALATGVVLSTLVNLASAYYVWFTKTLLSVQLVIAVLFDLLVIAVSLQLIKNKTREYES